MYPHLEQQTPTHKTLTRGCILFSYLIVNLGFRHLPSLFTCWCVWSVDANYDANFDDKFPETTWNNINKAKYTSDITTTCFTLLMLQILFLFTFNINIWRCFWKWLSFNECEQISVFSKLWITSLVNRKTAITSKVCIQLSSNLEYIIKRIFPM